MNRKIKKKVLALLAEGDLGKSLRELAKYDERGLVNPLFSALCRPEEMLRWHTVTVFGEVLARLADKDMEAARIIMRRYIWSLNDESGGIGWGAPEAMAEAMYHHDGLCDEYLHMLISYIHPDGPLAHQDGNFLELPALQRGVLWGICRLAEKRQALLLQKEIIPDLFPYLESADATVRGLAAKALGLLGGSVQDDALQSLLDDEQEVRLYSDGEISVLSVSELAASALQDQAA
ncbi:MAG: HEAT repeat domain-containing protein [Desulfocapsa sp.]|nr:HEAT repeat domain-containing protein [Desulfocapsa sp.]MBN4045932.1 HEAT repeat domain-containing protein [bacterium AH-315-P11]